MFKNISIAWRLSLGFGMLAAFMLVMATVGLYQMGKIEDNLIAIAEVNDVEIEHVLNLRLTLERRMTAVRDVALMHGASAHKETLDRLKARIDEFDQRYEELLAFFKANEGMPKELEQMARIKEANSRLHPFVEQFVAQAEANKSAQEIEVATGKMREQAMEVRKELEALSKIENELNQEEKGRAKQSYAFARNLMITLLVLAILFGSAGALLITGSITKPVNEILAVVDKIAGGDLTVSLNPDGSDEIARLTAGVKTMSDALRQAIGQVRQSADSVALTAGSLSTAAQQVRGGSETQAESASAMAAALEEMSASVSHVSSLSDDARGLAQSASQDATAGAGQIAAMVEEISRVSRTIEESAASAHELGRESERISTIVSVIKDVADQTNLLALNAAIEAARAGETGRGFAVVADEVRKLAERTAASAQEITLMVHTIQERSRSMTAGMEATVTQMREGMAMAESAGGSVREIEDGAKRVTGVIDDVASALKEQASASHDLANRVENIVQMVEENSTAVGSVASSANDLNGLADGLVRAVARFRTV